MISGANSKVVASNPATTQATNATSSFAVDMLGYNYGMVDFVCPPAVATNSSAKWRAAAVYEADTTTFATTYAVMVGTTNTTASAGTFILNVWNDTAVSHCIRIGCDWRGRRRYLHAYWAAPAITNYTTNMVVAHLLRGSEVPDKAAEFGASSNGYA